VWDSENIGVSFVSADIVAVAVAVQRKDDEEVSNPFVQPQKPMKLEMHVLLASTVRHCKKKIRLIRILSFSFQNFPLVCYPLFRRESNHPIQQSHIQWTRLHQHFQTLT